MTTIPDAEFITSLPDTMTDDDFKLFAFLVNNRTQALLAAMNSIDIGMLLSFLRSVEANTQALEQYEILSHSLSYLQTKYGLGQEDGVNPDHTIVRRLPPPPTQEQMAAAQTIDKLNGHTPTPLQNRAQRRHSEIVETTATTHPEP